MAALARDAATPGKQFMAPTHVKILEVFAFHEPAPSPRPSPPMGPMGERVVPRLRDRERGQFMVAKGECKSMQAAQDHGTDLDGAPSLTVTQPRRASMCIRRHWVAILSL